MYEQMLPPEPRDVIREGLPSLRHGTIHKHPLELHLRKEIESQEEREYNATAALFGIGFANHIKRERNIIKASQIAYTGTKAPSTISMEVSTGDIDDIDFADMFVPNGAIPGVEMDPHQIHECRYFKK